MGLFALAKIMKAPVGAFRSAFAGKHPLRIFIGALKLKNTGSKWKFARNVLHFQKLKAIAPVSEFR